MKTSTKFFIIWLLCGVLFFIASNFGLKAMPDKDDMIKITGAITDIEVDGVGDDKEYDVYVEYEVDNQVYENKLGYYSSSFKVGQEITLYYEEGKPSKVYAEGEETFLKIFNTISIVIMVSGVIGVGYTFIKKEG